MDIEKQTLTDRARKLAKGSAPGPSGWTRELLIPLLEDQDIVACVTWIATAVLRNSRDAQLRDVLTSSTLILLRKEGPSVEGSPACRPIALGEIFLKLASQVSMDRVAEATGRLFQDTQFGVGTRNGGPKIILRARNAFRQGLKAEVLGCMERRRSALTRYEESKSAVRKETSELHDVHSLQLMDKRTRNWTEARRNRGEYFMRDAEWQTAILFPCFFFFHIVFHVPPLY